MINFLGFGAYLVSTSAFYGSPLIRAQYAVRNPLSPEPTVRFNDLAFVVHAFVLSAFAWSMFAKRIWGFKQGNVRIENWIWVGDCGSLAVDFVLPESSLEDLCVGLFAWKRLVSRPHAYPSLETTDAQVHYRG